MTNIIITLLPYIAVCGLIGYLGKDKKFGLWGNFAASVFLSPLIGVVLLFAQNQKSEATTEAAKS